MRRWWLGKTLAAWAWLQAEPSFAVRRFPREIQSHLGLSYQPPCELCHQGGNTIKGTVITPFGWSAVVRGLTSDDRSGTGLNVVLDAMKNDAVDSDGDGVPDIAELQMDRDPNTLSTAPYGERGEPSFGCSAAGRKVGGGALPVVGVAWLLARQCRRRQRRR